MNEYLAQKAKKMPQGTGHKIGDGEKKLPLLRQAHFSNTKELKQAKHIFGEDGKRTETHIVKGGDRKLLDRHDHEMLRQ